MFYIGELCNRNTGDFYSETMVASQRNIVWLNFFLSVYKIGNEQQPTSNRYMIINAECEKIRAAKKLEHNMSTFKMDIDTKGGVSAS